MYYDRKNIVPEYDIVSVYTTPLFGFGAGQLYMRTSFAFENNGRRLVAIKRMSLDVEFQNGECFTLSSQDAFYTSN